MRGERLSAIVTVALTVVVWPLGAKEKLQATWPMTGHDVENTRSQPDEKIIKRSNVDRLVADWTFQTGGDVSATPAVAVERNASTRAQTAVYFPDWGGNLWKLDPDSRTVIWTRQIGSYNGIAGSVSRTSPVVHDGMVFIGDLNGNLMGIDAESGDLLWITELDPNPNTIVTASPILLGDRLYINTSSSGPPPARLVFRGSMLALDARTGQILWQSFVLPDNSGVPGGFAGGAFVNPPAIDLENGLVIGAAGQLYAQPDTVTACLSTQPGMWSESCFPAGAYFNSVVAFDLETGEPRWSFRGAGADAHQLACGDLPADVTWCPPADQFHVWDFAGSGANVFTAHVGNRWRRVVGIGQKSGVYWALDAATGELLWSRLVGPGSDPGGIQWGTAVDGRRIYAAIGHSTGQAYTLPSGEVITGGSWAALDPGTGEILWQTPDPQGARDLASLTVANGILYGASMAQTGDQMYALDARNGRILWSFAAGGSVVGGPAVVDGAVYWGSGYARTGGSGNDKFYVFRLGDR
jgi:polyvinyl alcohol dehydrogenase (cytochrome)